MPEKINLLWNPHYDFDAPANRAEIETVDNYVLAEDLDRYAAGQVVESPWGSNQVVEARLEGDSEICIKQITVKPGYMLSLQRHRGRKELWEVTEGVLTVIADGVRHDSPAGQSITLPLGTVHCMINSSDAPVSVRETQSGICREKDNIRLLDFNNRPTYPLTTQAEYTSALLYARIQADHVKRYGFENMPPAVLLQGDEE